MNPGSFPLTIFKSYVAMLVMEELAGDTRSVHLVTSATAKGQAQTPLTLLPKRSQLATVENIAASKSASNPFL